MKQLMLAGALVALATCGGGGDGGPAQVAGDLGVPILFATQVPVGNYGGATGSFFNHVPTPEHAPRGGSLMLRLPDGTLRNLTTEAGFGMTGLQGANSIAVREPCVHWDGKKALFSMVVGAPTKQFEQGTYRWQIYEVTGLGAGETASIRKIAHQPDYNNVSPIYGTDDKIIFVSDRPRGGEAWLYPQRDEYESELSTTGIWKLDEQSGALTLIEHAPSGVFQLSIDSFGRVIFTKWDHLQRDQQADNAEDLARFHPFTYADESESAQKITDLTGQETFPEARTTDDPSYDPKFSAHSFNHFFPWEINEDGSAEETLNHVGRQEIGGSYSDGSFIGDSNLTYYAPLPFQANKHRIEGRAGVFQMKEDPNHAGRFYAVVAPEFATGGGGTIVAIEGAPTVNPEDMVLDPITPFTDQANVPNDTGYFRNPVALSNGTLLSTWSAASGQLANDGSTEKPDWNYDYRLRVLDKKGDFYVPGAFVTGGITADVSWYTPDVLASWKGTLWEIDAVEVRARQRPATRVEALEDPEKSIFTEVGVDEATFRAWLAQRNLALIVSRNVTQRDRADLQQPYNLEVVGGVSAMGKPGTMYDISTLQIFQADQVRGYGDVASPNPGRRILPRPMHGADVSQPPSGAAAGSVALGSDGSFAAIVPAQRALTWQLVGPSGPVVRERNWVSFAPGEVRVCAACHGINKQSQTGMPAPQNPPLALKSLLTAWKAANP
jgi:hypothetical protein